MESTDGMGDPLSRWDGPLKATGQARYTGDLQLPGMLHAALVESTIARGRILEIDSAAALRVAGVAGVMTHETFPRLQACRVMLDPGEDGQLNASGAGQQLLPMQNAEVQYRGQHVAAVLGETLEAAREGAALVRVRYQALAHEVDLGAGAAARAFSPGKSWTNPADVARGDFEAGFRAGDAQVDAMYVTAVQHHVAMEPHATVAVWEGPKVTVYESSTWIAGVQKTVALWFEIPPENVHVSQYFVGGSFGSKGPTWPHVAIAVAAARMAGRPVRVTLTRPQTFTSNGYRPPITHRIRLAAKRDGTLTAIGHDAVAGTSAFDRRVVAPVTKTTRKIYACANCRTTYRLVNLNLPGPFTMRGPGETPGLFALESAMDELAYELGMDPIELRLKNDAAVDPETGKPWSSRSLRRCLLAGADRFGWKERNPQPRSMRRNCLLIGMGVAAMAYDAKDAAAKARAKWMGDGSVLVETSTCEQGTGVITILRQIASEALDIPVSQVNCRVGDTAFPAAPIAAGSQTTASVGSAVKAACEALRGRMAAGERLAEAEASFETTEEHKKHTCYSFGAHFAEVAVDGAIGHVEVTRYTGAFAAGRIVNAKTARSQLLGGIVWGIGMALTEGTIVDRRQGAFVNDNLAEYLAPTNRDVPAMDAFFLDEEDSAVNPLGVKGVGEIGTIGAAAAIANAVFHATGKRVRKLPIREEEVW